MLQGPGCLFPSPGRRSFQLLFFQKDFLSPSLSLFSDALYCEYCFIWSCQDSLNISFVENYFSLSSPSLLSFSYPVFQLTDPFCILWSTIHSLYCTFHFGYCSFSSDWFFFIFSISLLKSFLRSSILFPFSEYLYDHYLKIFNK